MNDDLRIGPLFQGLGAVLAQTAQPVVVLRLLLEQAAALAGADHGVFVEIEPGGELEFKVLHRLEARDLSGASESYSRSVCAHVAQTGETIRISDAQRDPRFMSSGSVHRLRLVALLCVPIHVKKRVAAVVQLQSDTPGHFSGEHERLVQFLAQVGGPLLEALQQSDIVLRDRTRFRNEVEHNRKEIAAEYSFQRFIGQSPAVRKLEEEVRRVARADFTDPILLLGDTGTGKSILARILHYSSRRASGPFKMVSAPNLVGDTVESTLFGHCKGAYTDATVNRDGLVAAAEGGTLFLDEIGDLAPPVQPRLLRLLEEKTYERLGENHERHADVRIIAATSRDLQADIQAGLFRKELFFRLNFVPIHLPSLSERRTDIPLLLRHFLDGLAGGRWVQLADDVADRLELLEHPWPANVRDIKALAVRLWLHASDAPVTWDDVLRHLQFPGGGAPSDLTLPEAVLKFRNEKLLKFLEENKHLTREEQAKKLGVSVSTLHRWLGELGLSS